MAKKGEITVKDVSIRTMKVNGAWTHNGVVNGSTEVNIEDEG